MTWTRDLLFYTAVAATAAAAGVAAGMLLAPASGHDTRRRLARRLKQQERALKNKGRDAIDRVATFASKRLEAGKEKLEELLQH
jgi:gas vesicle protein